MKRSMLVDDCLLGGEMCVPSIEMLYHIASSRRQNRILNTFNQSLSFAMNEMFSVNLSYNLTSYNSSHIYLLIGFFLKLLLGPTNSMITIQKAYRQKQFH